MSAKRHEQLHRIFTKATRLDAGERDAFLDDACENDGELRAEIDVLLAADERDAGAFDAEHAGAKMLAGALAEAGELDLPETEHPTQLGGYRIIRVLGEGGMGVVYEAEQEDPRRRVALKVVRRSMVTRDLLQRFRQEAQVLGHLRHPGIAQVYEAGTADDGEGGRPFFAMELVEGTPLVTYADEHQLNAPARLELIAQVCDAVHHAHQKGVIHRDLKPANILVVDESTSVSSSHAIAQPKILDFGVARATDADLQTVTVHTTAGQLVGTVRYMSPEQASGEPSEIDIRSDVYALGVIAYEMLTGRLPYDVEGKLVHEAVRIIREEDPSNLGTTDRALRGDVETIVAKTLEKDKERRYQSAADLASDIRRHLHDEPIAARPASTAYQLQKFARRNKAIVAGVLATLLVAVTGAIVAARFAITATNRAADLEQMLDFQSGQMSDIDVPMMGIRLRKSVIDDVRTSLRQSGRNETAIEEQITALEALLAESNFTDIALQSLDVNIFSKTLSDVDAKLADQPLVQAQLLHSLAGTQRALGLLDDALKTQTRALAIRRRLLGDDDPDTVSSIYALARLHESRAELAEAEPLYREAWRTGWRVHGEDHPESARALLRLSHIINLVGRTEEADPLIRAAREAMIRAFGEEHPDTLEWTGGALWSGGDMPQVESYFRRALEARRRLQGDDDPKTLNTMRNLAILLNELGNYSESESLRRATLEGRRRTFGDEHPRTQEAMSDLAQMLTVKGRALNNEGRYDEAEPMLRENLFLREAVVVKPAWEVAEAQSLVGAALLGLGRMDDAEPLLLAGHTGLESGLAEDCRYGLRPAIQRLVRLYADWGKPEPTAQWQATLVRFESDHKAEGDSCLRWKMNDQTRLHRTGENHIVVINEMRSVAIVYEEHGRMAEAEEFRIKTYEGRRRALGEDHPGTLIAKRELDEFLWRRHEADTPDQTAATNAQLPGTRSIDDGE